MSFYDDEFFEEEEDTYALFDDPEELSEFEGDEPSEEFLMANPPPDVHYVEYFFDVLKAWCGLDARQATFPYAVSMQAPDSKQMDYYKALRDVTDAENLGGLAGAAGNAYVEKKFFSDSYPSPVFVLNPGLIAVVYHIQESTLVNKKILENITISSDIMSIPDDYDAGNTASAYEVATEIWGEYDRDPVRKAGRDQEDVLGLPLLLTHPDNLEEQTRGYYDPYESFYNLLVKEIPHLLYQLLEHMPFEAWCNYTREANPYLKDDIDPYWINILITEMSDTIDMKITGDRD
jgi:hypothetical protein